MNRGHAIRLRRTAPDGSLELTLAPPEVSCRPACRPWRVALATTPVSSTDPALRPPTTQRHVYDHHRSQHPEADEVILWNERGEVTETTIGNIVIERNGWLVTPPLSSGLLPGTFRAELLAHDKIGEGVVTVDELATADALFMINAIRGWAARTRSLISWLAARSDGRRTRRTPAGRGVDIERGGAERRDQRRRQRARPGVPATVDDIELDRRIALLVHPPLDAVRHGDHLGHRGQLSVAAGATIASSIGTNRSSPKLERCSASSPGIASAALGQDRVATIEGHDRVAGAVVVQDRDRTHRSQSSGCVIPATVATAAMRSAIVARRADGRAEAAVRQPHREHPAGVDRPLGARASRAVR
ncbi:MAG: aminotransferase class IV [Acidimicrobiales bacterium]